MRRHVEGRGRSLRAGADELQGIENITGSAKDDCQAGDDKSNVIQGGNGSDIPIGEGAALNILGVGPRPGDVSAENIDLGDA